ncbi:MAG: hypothetical protein QG645_133, partial [Patescibacteria group bacterium]|nr:hypothetical protein [Patescibacteria group bacterium]
MANNNKPDIDKPQQATNLQSKNSNQKKEWYKKWWGIILAIIFWPYFIIYYAWVKSKWPKALKITATVICGFFILIGLVAVISGDSEQKTKTTVVKTQTNTQTPEQKANADADAKAKAEADAKAKAKAEADAKDFDASISFNSVAVKVTNNEDIDWVGCEVSINDKYGQVVANIPKKDSVVLLYTDFTSAQAERFNYYQTA